MISRLFQNNPKHSIPYPVVSKRGLVYLDELMAWLTANTSRWLYPILGVHHVPILESESVTDKVEVKSKLNFDCTNTLNSTMFRNRMAFYASLLKRTNPVGRIAYSSLRRPRQLGKEEEKTQK